MTVGLLMSAAARRPLAIPLSALCLSVSLAVSQPVTAQEVNAEPATQNRTAARQYNIPAQPLGAALIQFGQQSGLEVTASSALVSGKKSGAINEILTAEQALARMLTGTGLSYQISGGMVSLSSTDAAMLQPVTVNANAQQSGSAAQAYRVKRANVGVLGNASLQNTPYSVEVYSREYMDNLQARSLSDLTKYDAAISISADDRITENNAFMIRGITPDFDTGQKIDGLNLRSRAKDLPLEHIERVEVLKGAGGFLYGFGAPGGIVNYVLKRPTEETTQSLSGQVTDSGLYLLHGDAGGRFGDEDRFGYRVNLVGETGDTYINDGESERKSASVALDWRLTRNLTWQVDALYANRESYGGYWAVVPNTDGQPGNWTIGKPLDPIDGDKRLVPDWVLYESEHNNIGSDIIWAMSDSWDMQLSYRYSTSYRYLMNPAIYTDTAGNYSIQSWNYNNLFKSYQSQALITGAVTTGAIDHKITTGLSRTKTVSSNSDDLGTGLILANVGNLSNPVDFEESINTLNKSDAEHSEYSRVTRTEIFFSDTLHLGQRWDLILGARHGTLKDKYGDYEESAITPTYALIYRPINWMSLYASYVEAFEQGSVAPATAANADEVFDPMISKQYETGVKIDQRNWSANAALFRLQRALTRTDSNNVFRQDGEARYQGLELSAKTRLGNNWLVGASAMWLDASNEKTTDPNLEGKDIQGVAQEQYRLYSEYDVPGTPWALTGGATYTGERPVDADNQWNVDAVTLLDLGARYAVAVKDKPLTLRLNINNLTDEAYWLTTSGSGSLTQGAPRTVTLGAEMEF